MLVLLVVFDESHDGIDITLAEAWLHFGQQRPQLGFVVDQYLFMEAALFDGYVQCAPHSQGDSFTMGERCLGGQREAFYGMAKGMAEIQHTALFKVGGIVIYNLPFEVTGSEDILFVVAFIDFEHGIVGDETIFDHLGQSREQFPLWQGTEADGVDHHFERFGEGAYLVLAIPEINPVLSANSCIDHGQKRCGHVDEADAPLVAGGNEPPKSVTVPPPMLTRMASRSAL